MLWNANEPAQRLLGNVYEKTKIENCPSLSREGILAPSGI